MRTARRHDPPLSLRRHRPLPSGRSKADYILPTLAVMAFLFYARPFVLPVMIACVAGMALKPGMQWFARWRIPPFIAAALLAVVFLSAAGGFVYFLAPPAVQWAKRAPAAAQEMQQKAEAIFHFHRVAPPSPEPDKDAISQPAPLQAPSPQVMSTLLTWTGTTLSGLVEVIVLLYLILISNGWFSHKLAAALASYFEPQWVTESLDELQHEISHYLFSVTLINGTFGLILGSGLALMGLPNAPMWGGMAALLNFIPYFGAIAGMIIVGIVGILTFDTFPKEIFPLALYLTMHLLEADLCTPLILGQRFTIHPLVIFVSLLFWTWLWGVPGAFLAVPMMVALKVACERLPMMSAVGELLKK